MTSNLRCAVIGVGNMGQHHARTLSQLAKLTAICDINSVRGKQQAKLYGAHYYQDVDELLKSEKLDIVTIAVPTRFHHHVATKTLNASVPTLLEKPIAASMDEADDLVALAKKQNVVLMVGQVERFNPAVQSLKKNLDKGSIGTIISLIAIRSGISPPREKQSDVSLDLTIHDVDLCLDLFGETPLDSTVIKQKITSDQQADSASVLLRFRIGTALFSTNWLSPIKLRKLQITGTKGYAELDYLHQTLKIYNRPVGFSALNYRQLQRLGSVVPQRINIRHREPLMNELEFFLKNYNKPERIAPLLASAVAALKILLQ